MKANGAGVYPYPNSLRGRPHYITVHVVSHATLASWQADKLPKFPSLMINAHPKVKELPKGVKIVLVQGACEMEGWWL
mgnify:CR=1 FL=1